MELIVLRPLPQQMRLPASFLRIPRSKHRQNIVTAVVTIITSALHKTNCPRRQRKLAQVDTGLVLT